MTALGDNGAGFAPGETAPCSRPPLRYLGGKWRLAPWITSHFPKHRIYLEGFAGGLSVLFRKPRSYNEIVNDLDGDVVNLFTMLRDDRCDELIRAVMATPYARTEYLAAYREAVDPVERARLMLVRSHMGHGTGGVRIDRPTGFRNDGVSGSTNVAGEWAEIGAVLAQVSERLRGVTIERRPAVDLIKQYDDEKVLAYLDPPYLPETRSPKNKNKEDYHAYRHEMTVEQHREMLAAARESRAMIILSGYPSALYDEALPGWKRVESKARAHRNAERTEVLWINPRAAAAAPQAGLF